MSHSSKVILIVEDEPLIRMCAVELAEDAGFAVLEAPDAEGALDHLADCGDIGLLFTDISLPGPMNGIALAERAVRDHPRLKVLISSGKAPPSTAHIPADTGFLPKPYDTAQWLAAVNRLIA